MFLLLMVSVKSRLGAKLLGVFRSCGVGNEYSAGGFSHQKTKAVEIRAVFR
jgi:hypothetical protein